MTVTHDQVEADPIPELISDAFDATRTFPPHERLVEIDKLLHEEIARLTTLVQRLAGRTPHRSRDWYRMVNALDRAEDMPREELSWGPLANALRVAELARIVLELQRAGGVAS
ncbi:DUF6415 family natural product biosynthesis protein [Streptomyces sp. NBC_00582]|uniref:DUF6415 family natural product biosynthesis protein n=1 Tax=Streptomyces sp. NBC_00582 TaxID=2975783 RepID=UPI002E80BEA7|nr:DUF6415 family natural product biosynthesis protein [Streptomyces sp. NBC_00582]WUB64592.1 DUF6415 family natural product biosynthesis protein [Streptomyces sp. NBC_00582]